MGLSGTRRKRLMWQVLFVVLYGILSCLLQCIILYLCICTYVCCSVNTNTVFLDFWGTVVVSMSLHNEQIWREIEKGKSVDKSNGVMWSRISHTIFLYLFNTLLRRPPCHFKLHTHFSIKLLVLLRQPLKYFTAMKKTEPEYASSFIKYSDFVTE